MVKLVIIVLAFNEIESLKETIEDLVELMESQSTQIIISTSHQADPQSIDTANLLDKKYANVSMYLQKQPYVAAAVLEAIELFESEYIVYMSADKETPASLVPYMLQEIQSSEVDIVSASRWISGSSFTGYGRLKWLISKCAQWICKLMYLSILTEFTYGFRIYKSDVLRQSLFRERKHPFFLESLLVPLRLGYKIKEIPVAWSPRTEGESVVTLRTLVSYIWPIMSVRLRNSKKLKHQSKELI